STYSNFYFKRLRRIMPLAIFIVLLCVVTIALLEDGPEISKGVQSAVYSLCFMKNFQPHPTADEDYFLQLENGNDFFTHFWSLCVEMQFYVLAPFLLHICKPHTDNALRSFAFMTAIAAGSFAYSITGVPQEVFDSPLARLWQFLAGAMVLHSDRVLLEKKHKSNRNLHLQILSDRSVLQVDCNRSCLGDVSYSLYLIHWPIVCILDIYEITDWQRRRLCGTVDT
ncbi:hypothetical protein PENTCL1PPCAC_30094, partial [Pristionchus entomophagus]